MFIRMNIWWSSWFHDGNNDVGYIFPYSGDGGDDDDGC